MQELIGVPDLLHGHWPSVSVHALSASVFELGVFELRGQESACRSIDFDGCAHADRETPCRQGCSAPIQNPSLYFFN